MPTPTVTLAQSRMFAFSPYVLTVADADPNQEVVFKFNGFESKRYASPTGAITLPLSKILKSAWATEEVGDLELPTAGTVSDASKLFKVFNIETFINNVEIDEQEVQVIWGALQITVGEPNTDTIYRFGTRPLLYTINNGNKLFVNTSTEISYYIGGDYRVAATDTKLELKLNTELKKTVTIVDLPTCSDNEYIMWINRYGQYRFFEFIRVESNEDVKAGDIFTKEPLTMNSTTNGLYKSQSNVIDLSGNEIIMLAYPSATYEIQKFLQSLSTALKVYRFVQNDTKWVEVTAKFSPIKIDERWKQNQSIEFEIVMPNLYTQSL